MELHTFLIIAHVVGTALGAGGATASDFLFFRVVKDHKIEENELAVLRTTSKMVWLGLIVLITSGLGFLWLGYTGGYLTNLLNTGKLQAKLTIVPIILINGILLHKSIFPILKQSLNKNLPTSQFARKSRLIFSSGAISVVSWYSALILGAWRGMEAGYTEIMAVYLTMLLATIVVANLIGKYIILQNK